MTYRLVSNVRLPPRSTSRANPTAQPGDQERITFVPCCTTGAQPDSLPLCAQTSGLPRLNVLCQTQARQGVRHGAQDQSALSLPENTTVGRPTRRHSDLPFPLYLLRHHASPRPAIIPGHGRVPSLFQTRTPTTQTNWRAFTKLRTTKHVYICSKPTCISLPCEGFRCLAPVGTSASSCFCVTWLHIHLRVGSDSPM